MDLRTRQVVWRSDLLLRSAKQRHRRLVRELAGYRTQTERDDLLAAIDRCPSSGREEIRRLLVCSAARPDAESTPFHLRT